MTPEDIRGAVAAIDGALQELGVTRREASGNDAPRPKTWRGTTTERLARPGNRAAPHIQNR